MDAGSEHLQQRGVLILDGIGKRKHQFARHREIFGKAAVRIAPDQAAVWTEIKKTFLAEKAGPAVERGIDQNARAGFDRIAALDHFARDLVTHHARILHRNAPAENAQVGPADAGVRDADQHTIRAWFGRSKESSPS